jgi:hypothetical protein
MDMYLIVAISVESQILKGLSKNFVGNSCKVYHSFELS